jgi:curved DNA-binding protein CbpA
MHDLYAILGLTRRATSDEIRVAYRALAKRHHPDVNSGDKRGEWLTKEINHAYATLGNPEARTAYDRDLGHERAAARRRFWRSAATGAATFIIAVSSVWLVLMWKQTVSIHQSQMSEPAVLVGDERAAKNSAAEVVASRVPAASGDRDERDAPRELVTASVPGAYGEPLSSTAGERQGAQLTEREAHSAPIAGPMPTDKIASTPSSGPAQSPERVEKTSAPSPDASQRTKLAMTTPPEPGKQPTPASAVAKSSHKSIPPNTGGRTTVVGRIPKKSSPQFNVTEPLQGRGPKPRIASRTPTVLRWPSADEPFINLGGRSR